MKISNGIQIVFLSVLITHSLTIDQIARNVEDWSRLFGEQIQEIFESATKHNEIVEMYKSYAQSEIFDPRIELKKIKHLVENYLKVRSKAAWDAKVSLESRTVSNISELEVNDPMSMNFIRFMSAKNGSDAAQVFAHDHTGTVTEVNSTREVNLTMNANFYGIPTSSAFSSIHIPTPVYNRNPNILLKIDWSDIDQVYRANRQQTKDLSFQMFCSESGFMRYFPSAKWMWDNEKDGLDLFDCRSTTWYINGATSSKNVVIMLDMSGSMLGQRFEIAKQTVEAILETLSENDFFNIILFSKSVQFIDKCSNETLLQATLRNKKIVRAGINRFSSEGKAEYEKGLTKAFETLLKMHNDSGKRERFGCNDVIMLITDGAPAYFKEIFKLYNKNKHVRFFSFLIGEEATDFEQVRWMACSNKGFLLHINNLADVQEKVQQYIKAMSKAIGRYASTISQKNAAWSGLYKERLLTTKILPARKKTRAKHLDAKTEMYMTTVSYPVALNGTFMGVSAVTVAITELMQLAHPSNLGSRSYTFMMDNNGYVLFHPQLRQTDAFGQSKPSFNNVDILELEVPQNQQLVWLKISDSGKPSTACKTDIFDAECIRVLRWQMKKAMIQCNNEEVYALDVLFATEEMDRVYRQTNIYYSECIKDTLFTVGMAVAKGDLKRIKPIRNIDYGNVELSWFDDYKWKMHPDWRYCFLNDSDINLSTEEAFRIYAQQMQDEKKLPNLCEPRRSLVDKFLFDMKVTNGLGSLWRSNQNFAKKFI